MTFTRREFDVLRSQVQRLESTLARRPVVDWCQVRPLPAIYNVIYGNILNGGNSTTFAGGILRRTDTVAASEMPNGSGGSPGDTVIVPAFPLLANLPNGVGVGVSPYDGSYAYLLNDARTNFPGDLPLNRRTDVASSVNLDKTAGGVTYRYICWLVAVGL